MKRLLSILSRLDDYLGRGEAAALIGLLVIMTAVVFLQVIYRYLLAQPLHWSEELARYLFVWLSMIGASLAVKKRGHFGLDLLSRKLAGKRGLRLEPLICLLMAVPAAVILIWGIGLVGQTVSQESPAMGISMGWAYACLPAGGALMSFHLLVIFLKDAAPSLRPCPASTGERAREGEAIDRGCGDIL